VSAHAVHDFLFKLFAFVARIFRGDYARLLPFSKDAFMLFVTFI